MSGAHDEDPPPWQTPPAGAEGASPWQSPSPEAAREREPPSEAAGEQEPAERSPSAGEAPPWQSPPREVAHGPAAQWAPPQAPQGEAPAGHWQPPPGWQPGGQPQYGQRMMWQPAPPTPGAATASLLVGITAVVLLPLVGPVAVWLGARAKRRIDASEGALGGRAVANWGVVMGWIGVLLTLVMAALIAIYFAGD